MRRLFLCSSLLSVLALACAALVGDNRYGSPHAGNSLNHRGVGGGYSSGLQSRGASNFGAPRAPGLPAQPSRPGQPSRPAAPAFGVNRNYGSSASARGGHYSAQSAPGQYSSPSLGHYSAPAAYGGHNSYSAPAYGSGPSHYGPKRSVYEPQQQSGGASRRSSGNNNNSNYPQQHSTYQQHAESKSQSHGREMKYTINDPHNRGTTHVHETHVVTNRQMHGAEAEAAMKKLMGSMGPGQSYGNDGGFQDFVKGMGLPNFY